MSNRIGKFTILLNKKMEELNSLNDGFFIYEKVLDSFALNNGKVILCSHSSTIPKFIDFIDEQINKIKRKKLMEEMVKKQRQQRGF